MASENASEVSEVEHQGVNLGILTAVELAELIEEECFDEGLEVAVEKDGDAEVIRLSKDGEVLTMIRPDQLESDNGEIVIRNWYGLPVAVQKLLIDYVDISKLPTDLGILTEFEIASLLNPSCIREGLTLKVATNKGGAIVEIHKGDRRVAEIFPGDTDYTCEARVGVQKYAENIPKSVEALLDEINQEAL